MTRDLFRQLSEPRPSVAAGRFSALPISIVVHVLVLLTLVVIPLVATDVLPLVNTDATQIWTAVTLPQPPAAPMPRAASAVPALATNPNAAPTESPKGFTDENLLPVPPNESFGSVPQDVVPGVTDTSLNTVTVDTPPPPKAVVPIRVSGPIKPPLRIHDVMPVYPEAARLARVEGTVIIEAVIGPTGNVVEAKILRSRPLLDEAALVAVRQWQYTPTLLGGMPVPVVMTVTVTFTLR
jgi:protein TonB